MKRTILLFTLLIGFSTLYAQQFKELVGNYLLEQHSNYGLTEADIDGWIVTDHVKTKHNGVDTSTSSRRTRAFRCSMRSAMPISGKAGC